MKTFKKGLSIILSVLMALSCFALCAYAADDDISSLKVAVASDIHTVENEEVNDLYGDGMFGNKGMLVSLHDESYGIIDSFMREAIANGNLLTVARQMRTRRKMYKRWISVQLRH